MLSPATFISTSEKVGVGLEKNKRVFFLFQFHPEMHVIMYADSLVSGNAPSSNDQIKLLRFLADRTPFFVR